MSVNSSYPLNSSLDSEQLSCIHTTDVIFNGSAIVVTRFVLLFPLSTFVLYLGYQRWRQQQRSIQMISHSDIFTYHMAVLELIWVLGRILYYCGYYCDLPYLTVVGFFLYSIIYFGETFFHVLTCVERYLAVVHPITYRGLKAARGIRIRNISCAFTWFLCCVWSGVTILQYPTVSTVSTVPTIPGFFLLVLSLAIISFCSLSVLFVLIRQGPGEGSRDRQHVDQSKQRAFYTVMAITVVQWLWFLGILVTASLEESTLLSESVGCIVQVSGYWFSLPSSLVLPLLYLHKTRKLSFCT